MAETLKGKNVRTRGPWWHYQFEVAGKVYSGSTGLEATPQNQTAAEEFAEQKRQEVLYPALTEAESTRQPFDAAAAEFNDWAKNVEYRGKPNTAERLRVSMASAVRFFGDRMVDEIGPAAVEQYKRYRIEEHGVKDIMLRHDLHALSVFFQYALKQEWAARNPLGRNEQGVRLVKIPSDRDAVREHVVTAARRAGPSVTKTVEACGSAQCCGLPGMGRKRIEITVAELVFAGVGPPSLMSVSPDLTPNSSKSLWKFRINS